LEHEEFKCIWKARFGARSIQQEVVNGIWKLEELSKEVFNGIFSKK